MRTETHRQGWHHVIRKTRYNFDDYVRQYGNPSPRVHRYVMGILKLARMRDYMQEELNDDYIFVSGIRSKESKSRSKNYDYHINNQSKMFFVSPIYYKTKDEILDYVQKNDVNISPIYENVHISGDCICGANGDEIERLEIRIHYPEAYKRILYREKLARESPYKQANINWEYGKSKAKQDRIKIYDGLEILFGGLVPSLKVQFEMNELELNHACSDCNIYSEDEK